LDDKVLFFAISISYVVNFGLLYTRKQKWNTDLFRWILVVLLLSSGIIIKKQYPLTRELKILVWCLTTPLYYNILDRTLKKVSLKVMNRDFYLWLRGSSEISDDIFAKNPHVNWIDKVFSILLLITNLCLPLFW
jgi:hypothetical protein